MVVLEPFRLEFWQISVKASRLLADTLSISNQHSESDNERDGSP